MKRKFKVGDVVLIEPSGEVGEVRIDFGNGYYIIQSIAYLFIGTWFMSEELHKDRLHYIGKL